MTKSLPTKLRGSVQRIFPPLASEFCRSFCALYRFPASRTATRKPRPVNSFATTLPHAPAPTIRMSTESVHSWRDGEIEQGWGNESITGGIHSELYAAIESNTRFEMLGDSSTEQHRYSASFSSSVFDQGLPTR